MCIYCGEVEGVEAPAGSKAATADGLMCTICQERCEGQTLDARDNLVACKFREEALAGGSYKYCEGCACAPCDDCLDVPKL
jgi:hypothetical protein